MRRALLERPFLHRLRDDVRDRGVQLRSPRSIVRWSCRKTSFGRCAALCGWPEDVVTEDRGAGRRQVRGTERRAVRAPLSGVDVGLTGSGHRVCRSSLSRRDGRRCGPGTGDVWVPGRFSPATAFSTGRRDPWRFAKCRKHGRLAFATRANRSATWRGPRFALGRHGGLHLPAALAKALGQGRVGRREDLRREQPGVHSVVDRDGRDRNAARHLHDRQQRVHAVERRASHRHPDDRQHGDRGEHPGRCAAPPAPAMMTFRPRPAAVLPYSIMSSGVRCADTTRTSCGTPRSVSASAAADA